MGRMDSPSLLFSNRKQLASASASVHFRPIISLRRQPVSASWRMMSTTVAYFSRLAPSRSIRPQNSILRLRQSTLSHVVLWLADAMGRVAFDNTRFDGVGKDATNKTDGTRGCSSAASDDGLPPQLLGLNRNPRL